jgi:hypothetical protein
MWPCSRAEALLLVIALVCAAPARADDLADGVAAYQAKNYARAFLLLAPLAERGEPEAEFVLGQMHRKGRGLVKSTAEALPLLSKAAEAGHAGAQNALGQLYEAGEGVDQNFDTALHWFQRAAESGDARAQLNLGLHYIRVEDHRDFGEAAKWLRRAAEQGEPEAQYFLARLLLEGRGVGADADEAKAWFEKAAARQHVQAQRFLRLLDMPAGPDRELELRELRRHIAAGQGQLQGVAGDPAYGADPAHPIRAGRDYAAEWAYLNALRGPQGQVVYYRSLGHCCLFAAPQAESGKGFLDRYEVGYDGMARPAILYFTLFADDVRLEAPAGFDYAHAAQD